MPSFDGILNRERPCADREGRTDHIPRRTLCRWYDRYLVSGPKALADRPPAPSRVWNRVPAEVYDQIIELALAASGCAQAHLHHRPRLLSDNGPSYIAGELADYIKAQRMSHVRGAPFHPQTQGKIERWHQTLKNRILLENYFLPGDLEGQIEAFIEHYNHQRYHESLDNVTPADAYFGRASAILKQRERIKRQTIEHRRLQHRKLAA